MFQTPKITKGLLFLALSIQSLALSAQNNFTIISYGTNAYFPRELFFGDTGEVYQVGQCSVRGTINNEVSWNGYCYTPLYIMGGCSPSLANTFVVGKGGLIRKNSDCEIFGSWSDQVSGISDTLYSIKFFDIQTGVCVGQNGRILRTTNNGKQWSIIPSGTTASLRNLQIISDSSLIACGGNGTILKSNDRGLTWNPQTSGVTTLLNDIDFVGSDTGYAVGRAGLMLNTTDGGLTWNSVATGVTSNIAALDFVSGLVGMIAGDAGVVKRTSDGGQSWTSLPFSTYYPMMDIKFKNKQVGYLLSNFDFYKTTDGGLNWHIVGGTMESVKYLNDTTLIAVGDDNVSKSTDGGLNWKVTHPINSIHWYDCAFPSQDTGYICGTSGKIMKTLDGGNTYSQQTTNAPANSYFFGMHFFTKNKGIAVGSDYMISRTNNGGQTWTTVNSSSSNTYSYYDVFFINNQVGWICGSMGTLRKTVDGGATFTSQTSGVTKFLLSVYFLTPLKGFACGEGGTLLKTLDGGVTWTNSQFGSSSNFYSIAFRDSLHGFLSGDNQILYETTDGGATWKYINNNFTIKAMTFRNQYHGYAVGPYSNHLYYDPFKVFNGYSRVCKGSNNSFVGKLIPGISIQPGNSFIMEMDTTGDDFSDALFLGAFPDTVSTGYWNYTIPYSLKPGTYKTRVRATNMSPVYTSLTTNMTVYDDPEAALSIRNDTLFTAYNPKYVYQWWRDFTLITGANTYYYVPTLSGKYTVRVQYGCCSYAQDVLTLNSCPGGFLAQPTLASPYVIICDSSSTTLTASGAAQYHWYNSDTSTTILSSSASYTTPILTTRDSFYVAAYNDSCESARVLIDVYVTNPYPAPTVTGDSVCAGSSVFLVSAYGTYSYWYADSLNGTLLKTAATYYIPNLQATDTFYVSNFNYQCESKRTPVIAYAYEAPATTLIAGDTAVTIGDTAAYAYTPAPGNSIQWFVRGGTLLSTNDSLVVKWADSTTTAAIGIIETNATGCSSDTVWLQVEVDLAIAVPEIRATQFGIHPNPANNRLLIERKETANSEVYSIYQSNGKLEQKLQVPAGKKQVQVDTSKYANGTYFIRSNGAKQGELKFVILHN